MNQLGNKSLDELKGVDIRLIAVTSLALLHSTQDFAVHDGIRTLKEQEALVKSGASRTLDSKHLSGHAVDLVPYVNGKLRWEWKPIYTVTRNVWNAANKLGIQLRWGGVWDRQFLTLDPNYLEEEVEAYVKRQKELDRKAFLDGPHFELVL